MQPSPYAIAGDSLRVPRMQRALAELGYAPAPVWPGEGDPAAWARGRAPVLRLEAVLPVGGRVRLLTGPDELRDMLDPARWTRRLPEIPVAPGRPDGWVLVVDGLPLHRVGRVDVSLAEEVAAAFPDAFSFAVGTKGGRVTALDPWPTQLDAVLWDGVDPYVAELLALQVEPPFPEGGTAFDGARET